MCGIAGFSGRFDPDLLERMGRRVGHRGPDDAGAWINESKTVGMVHRRLSIIDLSVLGRQPMRDRHGNAAIVFNGEIYNYRELREDLRRRGREFASQSDTEVILNLYLEEGTGLLSKLNGIYAFAIWDAREETLFLARDGVGVKPLYYFEGPKGFLYASEMKAILEEPSVDRKLRDESIASYLMYLWCPAPYTMLSSVLKLEPGGALMVHAGKVVRKWTHYDLPCVSPTPLGEGQAVEKARVYLDQAIKRQLVADVPVGAFLSGGVDSTAVVSIAQRHQGGRRMQCFCIGFNDPEGCDGEMSQDLKFARLAASRLNVDLHTVTVDSSMMTQLEKMIYHLDEPQADPAAINTLLISGLAKACGISVLLSGAGGDDIFGGYRRHAALNLEKYWAWLPRRSRTLLGRLGRSLPAGTLLGRRANKALRYAGYDAEQRMVSYFYWTDPEMIPLLMRGRLNGETLAEKDPLLGTLGRLPKDVPAINRMLYLEGKHFLADHNLNYVDKMSMANGVEVRVPLLDLDLIAFAASLPGNYKQRGGTGKWVFREAVRPFVPPEILCRSKAGFGVPLRAWLRGELRPMAEDLLSPKTLESRGIFDAVFVKELREMDRTGQVDASYTLFSMMCIEIWCRIFMDRMSHHESLAAKP